MAWFLYDKNLRHERVKLLIRLFSLAHVNPFHCTDLQTSGFLVLSGVWKETIGMEWVKMMPN